MGRKPQYPESDLTDAWRIAFKAGVRKGNIRNQQKKTTQVMRRAMLTVALDLQDLGVEDPASLDEQSWIDLAAAYRTGSQRTEQPLEENTIRKRKEALTQMLSGMNMTEHLEFLREWKPKVVEKDVRWWTREQMEAMNKRAIHMLRNGEKPARAIAHLLHFQIAPRRDDTASFKWEWINLDEAMIRFRASKNGKICQVRIEPRLIPLLRAYKASIAHVEGGDVYVFPSSAAGTSGTTKTERLHVTDKSIAKWLAYVRDSTPLDIPTYSSHSYRHSLAMRYLNTNGRLEDVASILGDKASTIESHYSEYVYTKASDDAWRRAHTHATKVGSEGTVQPEWLMRPVGFTSHHPYDFDMSRTAGSHPWMGTDAPGFEPGSSA